MSNNFHSVQSTLSLIAKIEAYKQCLVLFAIPNNHQPSAQMIEILQVMADTSENIDVIICDVTALLDKCRLSLGVTAVPLLWSVYSGKLRKCVEGAYPQQVTASIECLKASSFEGEENLSERFAECKSALVEYGERLMIQKRLIYVPSPQKQTNGAEIAQILKLAPGCEVLDSQEDIESMLQVTKITVAELPLVICDKKERTPQDFIRDLNTDANIKAKVDLVTEELDGKIREIITKHPVVLFMKGTKSKPFCKFSREMVHLLNEGSVEFDYFDVFSDAKIRERLKVISQWPTYPQLYVKGELIGGLDIVKELLKANGGDMRKAVSL